MSIRKLAAVYAVITVVAVLAAWLAAEWLLTLVQVTL